MKKSFELLGKMNKRQLIGILIIGVLLLLLPTGLGRVDSKADENTARFDYESYANSLEKSLEKTLNQMKEISEAEVMITLKSGFEYVPAYESGENSFSKESGNQGKMIVLKKQGGSEEAFVVTEKLPVVQGVLVIAKGADNSETKWHVVEAVKTIFDIPTSKVKVLAK